MAAQRDAWDRWKLRWQHAFFGVLLTLQVTRGGVLAGDGSAGTLLRLILLVALVGWYAYWYGPWPQVSRPATTLYLIGAVGLWTTLTVIDPAFWIVGFAVLVPLGMSRPGLVAFAVAVCGALWLGYRATGSALTWPEAVASALTVAAGVACLGYVAALDREGRRRARLLDELAAAQAERAASERHAATLAERQRLARDVHDTLAQGFASIVMLLEAVQESRNDGTTVADPHIATALRTARDNLAESRRLVWALKPASLEGTSLPDAVRQETHRLAEGSGIAASTVVTGDPARLDERTEAGVLRVVQEALTNARRHGRASTITVTLSYLPDVVLVDIQDDGVGMPVHPPAAGMGMRAMRERARELGATFSVESEPAAGTTIVLAVPARTARTLGAGV